MPKKSSNELTSPLIKQQQAKIVAFAKKNENLSFEIIQDRKQASMLRSPGLARDLQLCKGEIETYLRKVRMEELMIKETQQSIRALHMRQQAQRRARGGENVTRYNNQLLGKQAHILQQRLDVTMVKYNKILGVNMKLRKQIDAIVHHRDVFDKIFTRIGAETSLISDETARLNVQIEDVEKERDLVAEDMDKQTEQAALETKEFEEKLAADHEARKIERRRAAKELAKLRKEPKIPDPNRKPDISRSPSMSPRTRSGDLAENLEDGDEPIQVGQLSHEEEAGLLTQSTIAKWNTVTKKKVITTSKQHLFEIQKFFDQVEQYILSRLWLRF